MNKEEACAILAPSLESFATIAATMTLRPEYAEASVNQVFDSIYASSLAWGASPTDAKTLAYAANDFVERYFKYLEAQPYGGAA
jgi:hypothetical protein